MLVTMSTLVIAQRGTGLIQPSSPEQFAFAAMADMRLNDPSTDCTVVVAWPIYKGQEYDTLLGWYPVVVRFGVADFLSRIAAIGALLGHDQCGVERVMRNSVAAQTQNLAWMYSMLLLWESQFNPSDSVLADVDRLLERNPPSLLAQTYHGSPVAILQDGYGLLSLPEFDPACDAEPVAVVPPPLPEGTDYSNPVEVMKAANPPSNVGAETTDDVGFSGTQLLIGVAVAAAVAIGVGWVATRKG